ncbi:hypothetical protein PVAND_000137 [Polypedilum vanderplanki]|uniref:carbonic anhydrase n=1 Tax=Polypedilum vanderplanki TaxID=319348 RepID=A0A9J6BKE1_POLVA|nr:hypothetical protein PVAND_000137 [Polypedilum vanderplanki]
MDRKLLRLVFLLMILFVKKFILMPIPQETTQPEEAELVDETTKKPDSRPVKYYKYNYNDSSPDGPKSWPGMCTTGVKQSPISITPGQYLRKTSNPTINITFDSANFKNPKTVKVINNGHGATYTFIYDDNSTVPKISGGILGKEVYEFASFHMHWPCEHSFILTDSCALEVHLVHFNSKYKTLDEAKGKPDGLAVIALLYVSTYTSELTTLPYIPMIKNIIEPNTEYDEIDPLKIFNYHDVIHLKVAPRIVSYKGSLTTPGCSETVSWLIFVTPHLVLESDMRQLKELKDPYNNKVLRNNRPVQPLNGRSVYLYVPYN